MHLKKVCPDIVCVRHLDIRPARHLNFRNQATSLEDNNLALYKQMCTLYSSTILANPNAIQFSWIRRVMNVVSRNQIAPADRGCCGEDAEANSRTEQSTQAHLGEDFPFQMNVLALMPK